MIMMMIMIMIMRVGQPSLIAPLAYGTSQIKLSLLLWRYELLILLLLHGEPLVGVKPLKHVLVIGYVLFLFLDLDELLVRL